MRTVPNSPKTPAITARVEPALQKDLDTFAAEREITRTDVVREAVEDKIHSDETAHHSCTHNGYGMTCQEFDALMERAGGVCEICGKSPRKLWIDHDHQVGWSGVRGLVCPKCNAHMRRIDSGERIVDEATARYMDNAWHYTARPGLAERAHDRAMNIWRSQMPTPPRRGEAGKRIMTQHSFECEQALWEKARAAAGYRKESVSSIIRKALMDYVDANYVTPARQNHPRPHHTPQESTATPPDTPTRE